ncbi:MAG: hypothetical protein WCE45_05060 [Sedimentisphaerales bacterium]
MPTKKKDIFKLIHFASTAWFMLCTSYILVLALRQAGFRWWVIFSLSGYSVLLILFLVSLYLFAVFRGIDRSQKIEIEHPLTSTVYYAMFYDICPFLGSFAGLVGMIGTSNISELLSGIALGSLATTFLVWIVVDPMIGFFEKLTPASRKHRTQRLLQIKALRQQQLEEQNALLEKILAAEEQNKQRWQQVLQPYSGKLAELLSNNVNSKHAENEAVGIGANAWQMGGLNCMRQLYSMTMEQCNKDYQNSMAANYLSNWWDGIGTWQNPSLG